MNLRDTYNKIAEEWHRDHVQDDWWKGETDRFVSLFKRGDEILDIGCGAGTKSKYLLEKGLSVTGIDFSENMIEIAKRELPSIDFKVLDLREVGALQKEFDGIFMQAVLLHIPKKDALEVLIKVVEKLRKDGYLYVAVKEKIEDGIDEEVKTENDYGYDYSRFFSYFTKEELENYFKNIGLEIVSFDCKKTGKTNWLQIIGKK